MRGRSFGQTTTAKPGFSRLVFGFYRSVEHGQEALVEARANGFRSSAVIHRGADGSVHHYHGGLGPRDRAIFSILISFAAAVPAAYLDLSPLAWLGAILFALLAAWFLTLAIGLGLRTKTLRRVRGLVLPGESMVAVETTARNLGDALAVLRRIGQPAVFAMRPGPGFAAPAASALPRRDPVTLANLADCAGALAGSHELESSMRSKSLLPILNEFEALIEASRADLAEAERLEYAMTNEADWLLDNAYLIRSNIADIRHNLPDNHNKILPVLKNGNGAPRTRVYHLAVELIDSTGHRLCAEAITGFLASYQQRCPLTVAELWVFPLMLRLVLIERLGRLSAVASRRQHDRELADFWANRVLNAGKRSAGQLEETIVEIDRRRTQLTPHFIERLGEQLHQEESALAPVQNWVQAATGQRFVDIVRGEQAEEANDLMLIASAIGSLRQLSELEYPKIVESVSRMEAILREDPSGVHGRSDFATRDRCRRVVEAVARQSKQEEWAVAALAVELAQSAPEGSRERCVSYFLLDDGLPEMEKRTRCKPRWRQRARRMLERRGTLFYLGSLTGLTAGLTAGFLLAANGAGVTSLWVLPLLGALAVFPASELATYLLQLSLTWLLPARVLPKMWFEEEGIPDDCRTLVVVPMMLLTPEAIAGEIEKLEVRYFANRDPNLWFSLLSDFTDATEPEMPEDDGLLGLAEKGIEQLNGRHGAGRFLLFHRKRGWCETEERWIGWERKRGKLEELNRLLNGAGDAEIVRAGPLPEGIRYVITLDADTQLPHGSARRLVETISHPLNRVLLTEDGRNRSRGYTIIQPRVSITLPSATATRFTRLFTDARGTDPYSQAVSDVYQDLFGEAIYHGKAIYDVHAFHSIMNGRFPEQRLLSHDLIEGAYTGVGLASDVELFEQFPMDYASYGKRQHRWIRGDWQIASWILPRVPSGTGGSEPNPLTLINRWKILDNLRRSLIPGGSLVLLVFAWTCGTAPQAASILVGLTLTVPLLFQFLDRALARWRGDTQAWREANSDLNRAMIMTAFLPHQAFLAADAIVRSLYRLKISKRHLLEWQTAEMSDQAVRLRLDPYRAHFLRIYVISAVYSLALEFRSGFWQPAWSPYLALWIAAPAAQRWIRSQRRAVRAAAKIEIEDQVFLRRVARETWRYFDDLVGPETNWLPPDNSQEALNIEVASRTSPTNIGLWLMSAVTARDLGYLTPDAMDERCAATIETLRKLETCEGHILNWYDIRTLAPLPPKYVSTVDSGNLIACLWVLKQSADEMDGARQLHGRVLRGLADTLAVIAERFPPDHTTSVPLGVLRGLFQEETTGIEILGKIRLAVEPARKLTESLRWIDSPGGERAYWITRLSRQIDAWIAHANHYLRWLDALAAPPDAFLEPLGERVIAGRRVLLRDLPGWGAVARDEVGLLHEILRERTPNEKLPASLAAWIGGLQTEYETARGAAAEMLERYRQLAEKSDGLAERMDMRFLYDAQRQLFAIGYQAGGPLKITGHYDLLASEARLGSLAAIAKGDVPAQHWLALGRPYTSENGQVLLSWSGTMFEYLMPMLFTQSFRNSMLENACAEAVKRQIAYAAARGVPWGISESAYSALDAHKIYQYRAFGVPSLGLKRGLEDELVVAPYATALALLVNPAEAIGNLKRFVKLGMYGRMGFYESLDYTRQEERRGGKGVVVYAYFAHHQGMSLMAFNNVLNRGILRERFHSDRRVKAVEPLLFERIPAVPSLLVHRPEERLQTRPAAGPPVPVYRVFDEDTPIPSAQLMGNGRYALMITNTGAGYSRWGEFSLTRWRADATRDNWGTFIYLRETEGGIRWGATHAPLQVKDPRYTATFSADRAEYRRRRLGIESHMEVTVSPEDDVEIRRITLVNESGRERTLQVTSAAELSLARHGDDRAHPAFSKLFIQTEALPELQALIAWRRPRSEEDPPVWMAQLMIQSGEDGDSFEYETDRARALGRGRSWRDPVLAMDGNAGYVLDPVFVMSRRVALAPRQQAQVTLVTAAAASREELLRLVHKYRDSEVCRRAFELAWSHAQLEHRYLGIETDAAMRFADLASHLLYPNYRLRAPAERLRRNVLTQSRLWVYGLSGDLPMAVVWVDESQGLVLVRELLLAHTYWRLRGFKADLVILNREPASYEQPLQEQLRRLVDAHSLQNGVQQPGGLFLLKSDQMPEEDLNLILSAAQATMGAVRGTLAKQLSSPPDGMPPPPLQIRKREEHLSQPLPFLELPYFNGLGGFTAGGREYAIYLGPNVSTPAPWINVMANPVFGSLVSESGSGCSWYGNSQSNRLTPWNNDPVADAAGEAIYIRDEDSGVFWTPAPLPVRELDAYRARHGQGYTEFEHNSHALEQSLLTFVPVAEGPADPVRVQRLRVRNRSSQRRRLSVTAYSELVLGGDRESTQMHVVTTWDESSKALLARNRYHMDYGGHVAFAAMSPEAASYSADRAVFLGRNGSMEAPEALRRERLANNAGPGLDPCAALQTKFELGPGEEKTVIYLLGQAEDIDHARRLIAQYRDAGNAERSLDGTRKWWDELLQTIQVKTPVLSVDILLNRWLLYQTLSCRIWGRTALYQSSGAYGFRDQLQDALAMVYARPAIARELILRAASRQFPEGDVQHWWHLPSGAGVRTRCSDDLLWLPYAVCQYIAVTGDDGILDAGTAFIHGAQLKEEEHEVYSQPTVSIEEATIFEHCRLAVEKGWTAGAHGLPLIGTCDWNDGMSSVGDEGKGESVWLAWFLVDVLKKFAGVCGDRGETALVERYTGRARDLSATVERTAWDGEWYLRAFFDDGTPLGSHQNEEARIDSIAQSWAVISGAGDPERAATAMRSVEKHLFREKEKTVLLFTPPFDKSSPHPGYIMGYPPGVRENGGQYTHAALWVAMALARMGEGERAVHVLQMLNPIEHSRTPEDCAAYKTEPYAVAADVYSLGSQPGRGGWTWYTGSSGWMYRVWLEEVLGFRLRGGRLTIQPAIPADWPGFEITFRYGKTEYRIEVVNGGERLEQEIALTDDGGRHEIRVSAGVGERSLTVAGG